MNQLMRIQIETHAGLRATPRSLYRGGRRIDIIEIVDQWYGPGYRYVKVRTYDNSVYILLFDEIRDQWELIMLRRASAFNFLAENPYKWLTLSVKDSWQTES
jgi:hypothetical protein